MKYRYGSSPIVALLAGIVVTSVTSRATAQEKPLWTVRYAILVATALPDTPKDAIPAVFEDLQRGRGPAIDADVRPFLAELLRGDNRFTYRVVLSGRAEVGADGECRINAGPQKDDPEQFVYKDHFRIQGAGPDLIDVHQQGGLSYKVPDGGLAQEWNGTRKDTQVGETYSYGITHEGNGRHVSLTVCILLGQQ